MEKLYRVTVTEVDPDTKAEKEVHLDEMYTGLTVVAECEDGRMAEVMMHENLMGLACKLASGSKTKTAVRLAAVLMDIKKDDAENAETALLRALMGE